MPDPYAMTADEIKAEIEALWDVLSEVPDDVYECEENEHRRERFHSLCAALHWKRLAMSATQ